MQGKTYWNQRYIKNEIGWDVGTATTPIITYINQVHKKNIKILIPGAGNAHEATFIFNNGFHNIFVLDWAEKALENFKQQCPEFPVDQIFCEDFFHHQNKYDLIIEQTFFCALPPKIRTDYVHQVHQLLKKEGKLVGVLFATEFEKEGLPYGAYKEDYIQLFEHKFRLDIIEPCYNSIKPRAGNELFIKFIKN